MVIRNRFILRLAGWLVAQFCRLWLSTLKVHAEHFDPAANPLEGGNRGHIFSMWHEDMLTLGFLCRGRGIYVLISRSRDGELLSQAIESLGFRTVRGSSSSGGASAVREIIGGLDGASAGITPDGPRGPRREYQSGAVFLSSRTGMPLVPICVAYDRPWRLKSWDKFAIPRPFSRIVICTGRLLAVPAGVRREALEEQRLKIAALMQETSQRAESLLRRWRKGEKLPLLSPEARAKYGVPLRKSA